MLRTALTSAALLVAMAAPAAAIDLQVTVTGVAHGDGTVRLDLYDSPETFRDEDAARARISTKAAAGSVTATVPDLTPGTYALIVYHDENDDGRMDRFLGMIPTEGYGLSNDPEVSGPPQFEASAFAVDDAHTSVSVPLHY